MLTTTFYHRFSLILMFALFVGNATGAMAQTTAFNYQGRLVDSGTPANGNYDFLFLLFDAVSGGTQQGATQNLTNVAVTNGNFTVQLNFGANFPGANRFLEIRVKPAGGPTYTTLSPRQQINSTPYTIKSLNATTADGLSVSCVNCVTSSQIQSVQGSQVTGNIAGSQINGTIPVASVPAGSSNYIQNTFLTPQTGNFNLSGNGTVSGQLKAATINATTQYYLDGAHVLSAGGFQNLFAGVNAGTSGFDNAFFGYNAGSANTDGFANSFFGNQAGEVNETGDGNTFIGHQAGDSVTTGSLNTFIGSGAGGSVNTGSNNTSIGSGSAVGAGLTNATAIGFRASVTQSNSLVLGSINGIVGASADTNVGIGTTSPLARLHIITSSTNVTDNTATFSAPNIGPHLSHIHYGTTGTWFIRSADPAGRVILQDTGGNVGVGLSLPNDRLQVFGDVRVGTSGTNGCLKRFDGTGLIGTCSSDVRLKKSIKPFSATLDKLVRLQPVYFYWRATEYPERAFGNSRAYGLIAQEVEKVFPEMVSEDDQGFKAVDYSKLPLLAIQAIKDQQAQIARQQTQIKNQQSEIEQLKQLVCADHPTAAICRQRQ